MRALIVLGLLLALAGCGEKSLMAEADVARFETWSKSYQQVAADMLGLSSALATEDLPAARERIDALTPRLTTSDKHAAAVVNPAVHDLLTNYMASTRRAVDSLAAIVVELEQERRPGPNAVRELADANAEMLKDDEAILDRVLEHTPRALRERVERIVPEQR